MASVIDVIRRILPQGTNPAPIGEPVLVDWRMPPLWPPDLFAISATLVSLSGAYAHASVVGSAGTSEEHSSALIERVKTLGTAWRSLDSTRIDKVMHHLHQLWDQILDAGSLPVSEQPSPQTPKWCGAALELMAIADEASAGIGFDSKTSPIFSPQVAKRHFRFVKDTDTSLKEERITATLCMLAPPEECCVQPKSRTPQVGCTLRSLSHHLALLPPIGEVTTSFLASPKPMVGDDLNLLVVPFPYSFGDDAIVPGRLHAEEHWGQFKVEQQWLKGNRPAVSRRDFASFLTGLIDIVKQKGTPVHGVILPELALDREQAKNVGTALAPTGINLFVVGVLSKGPDGYPPRNTVMGILYQDNAVQTDWEQSKHHRWRLDERQIHSYGLTLPANTLWWEDVDVSKRRVFFYNFLEGATLATLVCEDLARIDPVQPVLRAIGPNLVIALLMDGPQHEHRWPGRYATVLTEDPGSSVLTITSAGLVDRYIERFSGNQAPSRAIGLWKDASSAAQQIILPPAHHAVLLRLKVTTIEERTMDRRSDNSAAREIRLQGQDPVLHPYPPAWLTPATPLVTLEKEVSCVNP